MWTTIRRAAGSLAVTALCTATTFAQQRTEPQPKPTAAPKVNQAGKVAAQAGARTAAPNQRQANGPLQRTANKPVLDQSPVQVDKMIAGMLALCNEEEAAIGKFAAGSAQHEEVQKFANTMANDHAMTAKQLQKWSPEATLLSGEARTTEFAKAGATGTALPFDLLQVHQQIASRSIASMEKSLSTKKGADFDMAYVGSQCVMHQQMIDKASVLRQYASPELQAAIDKGIEGAETHLAHAHELIGKLASAEKASK